MKKCKKDFATMPKKNKKTISVSDCSEKLKTEEIPENDFQEAHARILALNFDFDTWKNNQVTQIFYKAMEARIIVEQNALLADLTNDIPLEKNSFYYVRAGRIDMCKMILRMHIYQMNAWIKIAQQEEMEMLKSAEKM